MWRFRRTLILGRDAVLIKKDENAASREYRITRGGGWSNSYLVLAVEIISKKQVGKVFRLPVHLQVLCQHALQEKDQEQERTEGIVSMWLRKGGSS